VTCRNGHEAERDARGKCLACLKGQRERNYAKHGQTPEYKAYHRTYYEGNREHLKGASVRARRVRCFGWLKGEFELVCQAQGGLCALCGNKRPLCADHCHTSGKRREALCKGCNAKVGFIEGSPLYSKALAYIARWKERND
jgi:hypothetical protein